MGLESAPMPWAWLNMANSDFYQSDPTVQPSELGRGETNLIQLYIYICMFVGIYRASHICVHIYMHEAGMLIFTPSKIMIV